MPADCHAHVFTRALELASPRRYTPDYDAGIADYLAMLDANGMASGVLVQPSFLGTDNSYLIKALAVAPARLRGIAVLDPGAGLAEMETLARRGVVGLRLNLIGRADPDFATPVWQTHLGRMAALGWLVEVQAEAFRLAGAILWLRRAGLTVVIDHFGRPDAALGLNDPGFRALLAAGAAGGVWVKLSGAYRLGPSGEFLAAEAARAWRQALGRDHLVWGSDWPHTQFEATGNPKAALAALERWLPDSADRHAVLVETPRRLFGLPMAGR